MEIMHAVVGPPCGGSSLLGATLNQNPRFYASSTSALGNLLSGIQVLWAQSKEIVSERCFDEKGQDSRQLALMRSACSEWYRYRKKAAQDEYGSYPVCFDKSRVWGLNGTLLGKLHPGAKVIAVVRDLRSVLASIERQHALTPELDGQPVASRTLVARYQELFAHSGQVGQNVLAVEDLVRRSGLKQGNLIVCKYEEFVRRPRWVLEEIYEALGEPYYEGHDFDNVVSTAIDNDFQWNSKFSHRTRRKIEASPPGAWREWVPEDIAEAIFRDYPAYMGAFGYTP